MIELRLGLDLPRMANRCAASSVAWRYASRGISVAPKPLPLSGNIASAILVGANRSVRIACPIMSSALY